MAIAIARLRRAAQELRRSDEEITCENLARKVEKPLYQVTQYVTLVNGLADELGILLERRSSRRFEVAVRRLQEQGLTVTLKRINLLTVSNGRSACSWLWKYSPDASRVLVSEYDFRRRNIVIRLGWIRYLYPHRSFIQKEIAEMLGYERLALVRLMRNDPNIRIAVQDMRRPR